jgi:hypothetical protein
MWRDRALTALRELADLGDPFTADDLRDIVDEPDPRGHSNGPNNSIGSVFRQAHAEGWLEQTGQVVRSRAPRRKGGMIQVWVGVHQQQELFR